MLQRLVDVRRSDRPSCFLGLPRSAARRRPKWLAHHGDSTLTRTDFLALLVAAIAAAPARVGASRLASRLRELIARYPARVAVLVQRVRDVEPLVAIRAHEIFPAASLIKLAIMLTVYRAIDRRELKFDTELPFQAGDIVAGSDSFGAMRPGASAPVSRLLKAMIQQSDNTAGNALIERLGFAAVNSTITRYGLSGTRLQRYFMHFSSVHDNLTTARDMAAVLLTIARAARGGPSPLVSRADYRSMLGILLGQQDHTTIAAGLPPGVPLANKTGELVGVRHDAAIVQPYGARPYVLVVLEQGITSQDQGVAEIRAISRMVYHTLSS